MHYSLINLLLTHSPKTRGKHSLFLVPCVQWPVQGGLESHPSFSAAMSCLFSSVDLETWLHTFITALAFMLCLLPRASLTPFSLPPCTWWTFDLSCSAQHLPPITVTCISFCILHHHCTEHRANTDQVVSTYWLDWKSSALKDLLPMNYFPLKSNPSLIHIFKWRWDSQYLKLVLLKRNSVALNAFTMLGNHIDLVLEHFHDSESNPECIKQYPGSYFPPHSSWKTLICFLSVSVDLPTLDSSYQWNHTTRDLFCLVSST